MEKKKKKQVWSTGGAPSLFFDVSSILFLALQALFFVLTTGFVCPFLSFYISILSNLSERIIHSLD